MFVYCALQGSIMISEFWANCEYSDFELPPDWGFLEGFMPSQFSMKRLMF